MLTKYKALDFFFKKKQPEPEPSKPTDAEEGAITDRTDAFIEKLEFKNQRGPAF